MTVTMLRALGKDMKEYTANDVQSNPSLQSNLVCIDCKAAVYLNLGYDYRFRGGNYAKPHLKVRYGHEQDCKYKEHKTGSNSYLNEVFNLSKDPKNHTFYIRFPIINLKTEEENLVLKGNITNYSDARYLKNKEMKRKETLNTNLTTMFLITEMRKALDNKIGIDKRNQYMINVGGNEIKFDQFYFESSRIMECYYNHLNEGEQLIVIQGVFEIRKPTPDFAFHVLRIEDSSIRTRDANYVLKHYGAEFRIHNPKIADYIILENGGKKREIAVLSIIKSSQGGVYGSGKDKYQYLNIKGKVECFEQITLL